MYLVTLVTLSLVHPFRGPIEGFVIEGRARQPASPPSSTAFGSHSRAGLPISDHITSESQQLRVKIALFYALGMRSIRCGSSLATLHASLRTFARISSPASRHISVPALRAGWSTTETSQVQ